jgi:hypothetical protein
MGVGRQVDTTDLHAEAIDLLSNHLPCDEMDPAQGRGWAVLKGDELHGRIFFHQGDDSGFVARRAEGKERKASK